MSVYRCALCGYIYDESKEAVPFSELKECPACLTPAELFELIEEDNFSAPASSGVMTSDAEMKEDTFSIPAANAVIVSDMEMNKTVSFPPASKGSMVLDTATSATDPASDLKYDPALTRSDPECRYMEEIHQMAVSGKSISGAMGTRMPMPGWDDILLLGAQLNPPPLNDDDPVSTTTVIGKNARKPMVLENPVYISHMSFGALSQEAKIALVKGAGMAKTATCSGEGGILPEEKENAYKYIFEYVPNKYSVTDENLKTSDAIEIKIGQGTKPGMGGHLPGEKVTEEVAAIRWKVPGKDIQSPAKFPELQSKEDLRDMVDMLRERSDGRPIGIKIAAGRIERDLEYCVYAKPDFITIDGRGGATGSSPLLLREATSVPTVYALYRARKYLDSVHSDISLVITGGLRVSSDFAKALAMGQMQLP